MDSVAEELELTTGWTHEQEFDTLVVPVPGFEAKQLSVQLLTNRRLQLMGERKDANKWIQFRKEIPIPAELDTDKISARLGNGTLYVKFAKVIAQPPAEPQPKPPTTSPAVPKPISKPEPKVQEKDQQQKTDASPKDRMPDKGTEPKQGDTTPRKPEDDKQVREGGAPKSKLDEEKKPKVVEEPEKGKKPASTKADDGAQKKTAAEEEKSPKVDAADSSKTGPSEKKGDLPPEPGSSINGKEGEERRKHDKRGDKMHSKDYEETIGGFLARMKQPTNLRNSIVVVLLVLMLVVYIKQAFKSLEERLS